MSVDPTIEWLLAGDPAIRWQTLRDLKGAGGPHRRARAAAGGDRRLGCAAAGATRRRWAGGRGASYTPEVDVDHVYDIAAAGHGTWRRVTRSRCARAGNCWIPDSGTMAGSLLPAMGQAQRGRASPRWCWRSADGSGLDDPRLERLAGYLAEAQMADGGWNCRATPGYGGATHGSFHTTISALEALAACGIWNRRGEEFLLVHRLFRSHRTGAVAKAVFTRFPLSAALALRRPSRAGLLPPRRIARSAPDGRDRADSQADWQPDGRWLLPKRYPGQGLF